MCVCVCIIHICRARTHKHALSLPRNDTAGTRLLHWRESKTAALFLGGVSSFCLARAFDFLAHFHYLRVLSLCLFVRLFSVSALVFARKRETCGGPRAEMIDWYWYWSPRSCRHRDMCFKKCTCQQTQTAKPIHGICMLVQSWGVGTDCGLRPALCAEAPFGFSNKHLNLLWCFGTSHFNQARPRWR